MEKEELENIVGNLLIAEYQVTKLRDRLTDRIGDRCMRKALSTYMFKGNDKWIKISINVEEMVIDKLKDNKEYDKAWVA